MVTKVITISAENVVSFRIPWTCPMPATTSPTSPRGTMPMPMIAIVRPVPTEVRMPIAPTAPPTIFPTIARTVSAPASSAVDPFERTIGSIWAPVATKKIGTNNCERGRTWASSW